MGDIIKGVADLFGETPQEQAAKIKRAESLELQKLRGRQEEEAFKRQQEAYERLLGERLGRAGTMATGAEEQLFSDVYTQAPEELSAYEEAMRKGTARELGEYRKGLRAELAKSGIRGAQALGLQERQAGEFQQKALQDILRMKMEDVARRQAPQTAFLREKARLGQATLAGA